MKKLTFILFSLTLFSLTFFVNICKAQNSQQMPMPVVIVKQIERDEGEDKGDLAGVPVQDSYSTRIIKVQDGRQRIEWSNSPLVIIDIPQSGMRYLLNTAAQTFLPFNLLNSPSRPASIGQKLTVQSQYLGTDIINNVLTEHSLYNIQAGKEWQVQIWRKSESKMIYKFEVRNDRGAKYSETIVDMHDAAPADELPADPFSVSGYTQVTPTHWSITQTVNSNLRMMLDPVVITTYKAGDSITMITRIPDGIPYQFVSDEANAVAPFSIAPRLHLSNKSSLWHFVDQRTGPIDSGKTYFGEVLFKTTDGKQTFDFRRLVIIDIAN